MNAQILEVVQRAGVGRRRDGHQKAGRVAPRLGVGGPGHVEQRWQPRPSRQVDTVADRTGQGGHFGAEPAHDNWRERLGPQKATGAPDLPSPYRSERGGLLGDGRPSASVAKDLTPQRLLLGGVRGVATPPAPMPSNSRPPLSSWSVAAMAASVPAGRFATLSTRGPTMMRGTLVAMAVSVVQHSRTRSRPCTEPARWS